MRQHLFQAEPRSPLFRGRTECGHEEEGQICIAKELTAWHTPELQEVDRPLWDFWVRRGFHKDDYSFSWTNFQLRTLMQEVYKLGKENA